MPNKITINDCNELAVSRQGLCLSKKCDGSRDQIKWKCHKGHIWKTTFATVRQGSWCPECSYQNKRLNLEQINKFVLNNFGGRCLSKTYKNNNTKLLWECEFGHQWEAIFGNIQNHGRWCPYCAKNARLTIEQMKSLADRRGGKCLSKTYINNHTKLLWECYVGHTWQMRPMDIIQKRSWCPFCKCSLGERCCKLIFEKSTGEQFKKTRPSWLKNKKGNNLELDGYCSKLNMAFEYNGLYHNEVIFSFHTINDLKTVKENDKIKLKTCKNLGISLFIINETVPFSINKIIKEIKRQVPFKVIEDINDIELEIYTYNKIEKYNNIAKSREGECLDNTWINSRHKIKWKCKKGHIWKATPNSIQQGSWCPKCSKNKKNTIDNCRQIAKNREGFCLDKTYKNMHTKMMWKCKENHIWKTTFNSIKHGKSWCPYCARKKSKS